MASPSKRRKTKFITGEERTHRIETLMDLQEPPWTWNKLAVHMSRSQSATMRALRITDGSDPDITLSMVTACANALDVSAGFLIDRKEVVHRHKDLGSGAVEGFKEDYEGKD